MHQNIRFMDKTGLVQIDLLLGSEKDPKPNNRMGWMLGKPAKTLSCPA